MAIYFTTPAFARAGVVAGFNLVCPLLGATLGSSVTFQFYVANTTVNGHALTIATGFVHWVNIGGRIYSYVQQTNDTPAVVATALANLINGLPDPNAIANASTGSLVLTARQDTGAEVVCTASESWQSQNVMQGYYLTQLTGNNLIPKITRGVLFAQGQMYRPAAAPTLPAAAANQQSWLFYSSTGGFYWRSTPTPLAADDAYLGWVVTNEAAVRAFSSRRIGSGEEAVINAPPALLAVEQPGGGGGGDTGPPAILRIGQIVVGGADLGPGQIEFGDLNFFPQAENTSSVVAATIVAWYVDETQPPVGYLEAPLGTTGQPSVSAALPAPGDVPVIFTFVASGTVGGVTIGPGYTHNISIGGATYTYVQQTGDTAVQIAAGLAAAINLLGNPDATALANSQVQVPGDGMVGLYPLRNDGTTVACTASDGNAAATLTERMATYILVEAPNANDGFGEIMRVNTGAVVRGMDFNSVPKSFPGGAVVWPLQPVTLYYALQGSAYGTAAWPPTLPPLPFRSRGLAATRCWATNSFGAGQWSDQGWTNTAGGRIRALSSAKVQMSVGGTLAIGSNLAQRAMSPPMNLSVLSISASVEAAPVGASICCIINLDGTPWASFLIPPSATPGQIADYVTLTTAFSVDGMRLPANSNLTLDVTAVGTTQPGSGLLVVVNC